MEKLVEEGSWPTQRQATNLVCDPVSHAIERFAGVFGPREHKDRRLRHCPVCVAKRRKPDGATRHHGAPAFPGVTERPRRRLEEAGSPLADDPVSSGLRSTREIALARRCRERKRPVWAIRIQEEVMAERFRQNCPR